MFYLQLLGGAALIGPEGPLAGPASHRHRLGLLALLALSHPRAISRDKLMALLWPESDVDRARSLLNLAVHVVRRAIGEETLLSLGDGLLVDAARLPSDVKQFESAVTADPEAADRLYAGPLLDGFFIPGSPEFERTIERERERLARMHNGALEVIAHRRTEQGDTSGSIESWRRLAAAEPFNSRIAMRLMQALESGGDHAGALQHGRNHARFLAEEFGAQPDAAVIAYSETLRTRRFPANRFASVAILPFRNLGSQPEDEYFADGITEDVIAHLSRISGLKVISSASVMQFKVREQSIREIGARLQAATLLDGSVRRLGDRVRIVAQLIDAETDQHLWAETYDRNLTDIFAIQTDVALHISAALKAELSPEERARINREPTSDLAAYRLYLQGRHCFVRYTEEGLRQSIAYYERAIERDPAYALAHAGVALACMELSEVALLQRDQGYSRAREAVTRALELDSDLGEAHCVAALLKCIYEFDWTGAEQEFKRALELSPGSADTHDLYGRLCSALQRYDEAIALQQRAYELDPLAHRADVATAYLRAGKWDEALEAAGRAIELDPRYPRGHSTLGWALIKKGMTAEGIAEMERAVSFAPDGPMFLAQLGQAYAMTGQTVRAREILRRLDDLSRREYFSRYVLAYVYTGLGDFEAAMDCLERAFEERAGPVYGIKGSFLFADLRSHPRFIALLKRMNLA